MQQKYRRDFIKNFHIESAVVDGTNSCKKLIAYYKKSDQVCKKSVAET